MKVNHLGLLGYLFWSLGAQAANLSVTESVLIDRVEGNRNELWRVETELEYVIATKLAFCHEVRCTLRESVPMDPSVEVTVMGDFRDSGASTLATAAVERYTRMRLQGHSMQFAMYMILHGTDPWPKQLESRLHASDAVKDLIAFPWISPDLRAPVAYPLQHETEHTGVINLIDGELGWAYIFPKKGKATLSNVMVLRFDAIEFAPAAERQFRNIFQTLQASGETPTELHPGTTSWWLSLKEKLKVVMGLDWRTPLELNPGVTFD